MFLKNEPAMPVTSFSLPPLRPSRRDVLIGGAGAGAGLLLPSFASAQTKLQVTEGNVAPLPIAIPNFVAGLPADGGNRGRLAQGLPHNIQRRGVFSPTDHGALLLKGSNIQPPPRIPRSGNLQTHTLG